MRKSKGGMFQKLRKSIPAIKTLLETIRVFSATCTNFQERLLRPRCSVQIINLYVYVWLILTSSSRVWFCKTQKEPWVIGPSLVASSSPLKMCVVVEGERNNFTNKEKKLTRGDQFIFFTYLMMRNSRVWLSHRCNPLAGRSNFQIKFFLGGGGGEAGDWKSFLFHVFFFSNLTPPDS